MTNPIKRIGVAVKFDSHTPALMTWARNAAKSSNIEIVLIHVEDPWTYSTLAASLKLPAALLQQAVNAEQSACASQLLDALKSKFPPNTEVMCDSRSGEPVDELIAAGREHELDLLVLGCPAPSQRELAMATSQIHTILQVANHDDRSCPIAIVHENTPPPFEDGELRVLIADDLREDGKKALALSSRLCETYGALNVCQLHVRSDYELQQVMNGIKEDYQGAAQDPEVEGILAEHRSKLETLLAERSATLSQEIQSQDGQFRIIVATGHVADQVQTICNALDPDLIIAGAHQVVHRSGPAGGQLPISRILQNRAGLLIL